jgi:hypothetical protein
MAHKHRKKGDWLNVVKQRNMVDRIQPKSRGLSNIPTVTDTGSAAYRRLQAKQKGTTR